MSRQDVNQSGGRKGAMMDNGMVEIMNHQTNRFHCHFSGLILQTWDQTLNTYTITQTAMK